MNHFELQHGEYYAENVSLTRLAENFGTPFYCYSSATLARHYTVFRDSLADLNPKICYAVKANDALAVLATLAKLGCGADVVSEGEIRKARAAGIAPQDIIFSGVGKTPGEMAYALEQGIFQFNVESEPELRALSDVAVSKGMKARIAIRVNPDVTPGTHAKISTGQKESKFGIAMAHALPVYDVARGLPGIEVRGVSVHIGSQLTQLAPFDEAFKRVRGFVDELRAAGHTISVVDLGGGLGVPYGLAVPPPPEDYAAIVRRHMADVDAQLVFEPGRLLSGNAGVLVTRVIYVKQGEGRTYVIVDAGMNDLIRPTLYEAHHDITAVRPNSAVPLPVDVVGPVCETGDIFAHARELPLPAPGDLLMFRTAGAYGSVMASTYNSRPLPAEIMVSGEQYSVIRPRQTYEDLLARDALPAWL